MRREAELEVTAAAAMSACHDAVSLLREAAVAPDALAEYVAPRRVILFTRPAKMMPLGEVWRLGTLLLGTDARLYALGHATRAAERGRPGYQSLSREERRDIAAAALRGGYAAGSPVNYDARLLPLTASGLTELDSADPIGVDADVSTGAEANTGTGTSTSTSTSTVRVRWRAGAPLTGAPALDDYLRERIGLLIASDTHD